MSMATLSRRLLSRSLYNSNPLNFLSTRLCTTTTNLSSSSEGSDSDDPKESDPIPESQPSSEPQSRTPFILGQPLENGLDVGIYKAILVGQVGQKPVQKKLKSGVALTMFSVGTGGIRNNRRPFGNENPAEYANRCAIQWHRVCVYHDRLGMAVMNNAEAGSILYLEGNLETKVFTDPVTGVVRRVREIAVRRNGRIVFLGKGDDAKPTEMGLKSVGYY